MNLRAGLVELLLCPVRALREYLKSTASFVDRTCWLFVSPRSPSKAMSKNGISFLLLEVIYESGACSEEGTPLEHIVFVVLLPPQLFSRTGPFLVFWVRLHGGPIVFTSFYF